jgi:hypothetical protein
LLIGTSESQKLRKKRLELLGSNRKSQLYLNGVQSNDENNAIYKSQTDADIKENDTNSKNEIQSTSIQTSIENTKGK